MNEIALQFVLAENSILILMNGKWLPLEVRGIIGRGWFMANACMCVHVCEHESVYLFGIFRRVCSDPSLKGSLQDLFMGPSKRWAMFRRNFNKSPAHTLLYRIIAGICVCVCVCIASLYDIGCTEQQEQDGILPNLIHVCIYIYRSVCVLMTSMC